MIGLRFLSGGNRNFMSSIRNVGIIAHVDAGNDEVAINIQPLHITYSKKSVQFFALHRKDYDYGEYALSRWCNKEGRSSGRWKHDY